MVSDYPGKRMDSEGRHHMEVSQVPIIRGVLIEVEFDGVATKQVAHGLPGAYRGAFQVASTEPAATVGAVLPDTASRSGVDVKRTILLETASAWTGTVVMWVF